MRRKKTFKVIAIMLSALILLLMIGGMILSNFIEKKISNSYICGYHFTSKDVAVNLFSRSVKIKNILVTDSIPGQRNLQIPELRISGISYFDLLFSNSYKINTIKILGPEILYLNQHDTATPQKSNARDLKLLIKKLEISDAKITMLYADSGGGDTLMSTVMNLEIWSASLGDFRKAFQYNEFGLNRFAFEIEKAVYYLPNKLYRLETNLARFDSDDSLFTINKLELLTNFTRYGIGAYAKTQQTWLDMKLDQIELNQIDPGLLLKDTTLKFNALKIKFLDVQAFKDRRLPFPQKPDTKLPMAMIDGFPFKLHCDSLNILNGRIEYTDRAPNSTDEGKISFENLKAFAENLSNKNQFIFGKTTMHASASVMGRTTLNADFVFPNIKHPEAYSASGHLNAVSLKYFNPILLQSAGAKINEGQLKNLWFNFSYNNDVSNGSMIFEYEGLNVDLMDRKEMEKKGITSFLANTFMIKKDNIQGEDNFKKGEISFERNKKKAIFNYWWKSLLSGIVSTVTPG